ncbi:hypothetical protein C8J56DRAFT_1041564 [Mycena floridula]|nr:hypothetical protein C8J56DRAFT_1041564 [Mycena floridula]
MPPYVTQLNNYFQALNPGTSPVSYIEESSGPANACSWQVTCKISGVVKGQGVGPSKAAAREAAAKEALLALGQSV